MNSYNPIQLSAWQANVDMKYFIFRWKVIEYCANYATTSELCSIPMKEVFQKIVSSLKEGNTSLTAVQKLLISGIAERDYLSQETCHLLQLPMFKPSRDFVVLSLDGSRAATMPSILDHHVRRPTTSTSIL